MNKTEKIFHEAEDIREFASNYADHLYNTLKMIDTNTIAAFSEEFEEARKNNRTIFVVGNGGSAGTASHLANDFGGDVRKKSGTSSPFRVMALTDNIPLMTAIANDEGYENIFIDQLLLHYRAGDKLVAISASGNSENVLKAAEWVREQGGKVISLVGFGGGKLKELSDVSIHVQTEKGDYGPVEDIHVIINHLVANWLQHKVKKEEQS